MTIMMTILLTFSCIWRLCIVFYREFLCTIVYLQLMQFVDVKEIFLSRFSQCNNFLCHLCCLAASTEFWLWTLYYIL